MHTTRQKKEQQILKSFKLYLNASQTCITGFSWKWINYSLDDFVYLVPEKKTEDNWIAQLKQIRQKQSSDYNTIATALEYEILVCWMYTSQGMLFTVKICSFLNIATDTVLKHYKEKSHEIYYSTYQFTASIFYFV
jgi:hypothetical protein